MPVVGVEGLPQEVLEAASWWERHIVEVIYGLPPDAPASTRPRPEYDMEACSLTAREKAKAAELTAAGHPVSAVTVKRHRQRYEADGLSGLVDHRVMRRSPAFGRVDPRVVSAMRQAVEEATEDSTRTASFVIWRTEQIVKDSIDTGGEAVVWPSQRSLYRLFDKVSAGRHTTGSASTRRSLAARPEGMFAARTVSAPGEVMEIDSTPLDVMVLLDDGVVGRVDLTGIIDVATGDGVRGGAAPDHPQRRRQRAAGPRADSRADAAGLDTGTDDGGLGAALGTVVLGRRTAGARGRETGDRRVGDRV
jgi:hypothetical protein